MLRLRGDQRRENLGEHNEHALQQFTRLATGERALPERYQQQEHSTTAAHAVHAGSITTGLLNEGNREQQIVVYVVPKNIKLLPLVYHNIT